jgi:nondiscriminating glutamyl-tRNA synthetase
MANSIRTRFAPSPTGHLHIGNARTAIMNWIFARHAGGSFVLRIEDTDMERSTRESENSILDDLRWLGLDWDEGPDKGGACGPYRQSERLDRYRQILNQLLSGGRVYPCYCTTEELDEQRRQMENGKVIRMDDPCRNLSSPQKSSFESSGRKPAYRFHVDRDSAAFEDLIRGPISFQADHIGDFIIARSDAMPMYNFACVVDDHFMNITHVIRGDDHVSNTPRQILIYRALGWNCPAFAHIPMILGRDRVRLSKRHGATSVSEYRKNGYLPEALVNFLSLLSWSSESEDEILSRERLIREFDFSRVSKSASVFDVEKLNWMNGVYIRGTEIERLMPLVKPFLEPVFGSVDEAALRAVLDLLHESVELLPQIAEKGRIFFTDEPAFKNAEAAALLATPEAKTVIKAFLDETSACSRWDAAVFQGIMKTVQQKSGVKGKNLWMPVRAALTGQMHGPDLAKTVEIFGIEKCRRVMSKALE